MRPCLRLQCVNFPAYGGHEATSCLLCLRVFFDLLRTTVFSYSVCYLQPLQQSSSYMSDSSPSQSTSTSPDFKSMLDDALDKYKKKTGNDLLALWLTSELKACESVDEVLDILWDQAKAFEQSGDQKLMKYIDPMVLVLQKVSDALGDCVSLVIITNRIHDDSK